MDKSSNYKTQPARRQTDEEIQEMQRKFIEESAWAVAMKAKVHQLATNGQLVLIKSDEGNGFIISDKL